jgi:hypothetical protein
MATRTTSQVYINDQNILYQVTGLANGDDSSAVQDAGSGDVTVQVTGTFGVGGTAIVEGSLDPSGTPTNWFQLKDPSNTAISFTAAGLKAVLENVQHLRVRVTAGDGTTALAAVVAIRRKAR